MRAYLPQILACWPAGRRQGTAAAGDHMLIVRTFQPDLSAAGLCARRLSLGTNQTSTITSRPVLSGVWPRYLAVLDTLFTHAISNLWRQKDHEGI